MPVAPWESLAIVSNNSDLSLVSSRATEESRDLQSGDSFVGNFGDNVTMKKDNSLRIGFQNVGGLPARRGKIKDDAFRYALFKWDFDIFRVAETNVDWHVVKEEDRLPNRTKEWREQQHASWSHNRMATPAQPKQFGGIALFLVNKAAHRAVEKGHDKSNLGRWAWTQYKGKRNQTFWIIVAYCPNPSQGPYTVYAQQNAYFNSIGRDICPRHTFLLDLIEKITNAVKQGDYIMVLLDGKSNMKGSDIARAFQRLSLR